MKTTNYNFALVLIIAFTGKQSYYNGQYMHVFVYTTIIHNKQIKGYKKLYMTDHTFIIGFCTYKSI